MIEWQFGRARSSLSRFRAFGLHKLRRSLVVDAACCTFLVSVSFTKSAVKSEQTRILNFKFASGGRWSGQFGSEVFSVSARVGVVDVFSR